MLSKPSIDKSIYIYIYIYEFFVKEFTAEYPQHLRFGQAFYNYFLLYKMANPERFDVLYNCSNREQAEKIINELFTIE